LTTRRSESGVGGGGGEAAQGFSISNENKASTHASSSLCHQSHHSKCVAHIMFPPLVPAFLVGTLHQCSSNAAMSSIPRPCLITLKLSSTSASCHLCQASHSELKAQTRNVRASRHKGCEGIATGCEWETTTCGSEGCRFAVRWRRGVLPLLVLMMQEKPSAGARVVQTECRHPRTCRMTGVVVRWTAQKSQPNVRCCGEPKRMVYLSMC